MDCIVFDTEKGFDYHWSGRFIAPNENWIHMTRELKDYELVLITEGVLSIECDGMEFTVGEGEYLLMPPSHLQKGTKQGYCSFYWLHFSAEQLMTPNCEKGLRIVKKGRCFSKERLIILLKELQDSDRRYRDKLLNDYLTGAVLAEISLQNGGHSDNRPSRSKEQLSSDIKTYISWHISEAVRIEDIADYFDYNEKYITTLFRKLNGIPLKRYILCEKMEYAKSILTESDTTVSEVAYSIGFSDVHNFSNAFKNITGMSPGVYRRQYDRHSIFDK